MLKLHKFVLILCALFTLVSCDCLQSVNGVVLYKNTGLPISDAKVRLVENTEYPGPLTDSIGRFNFGGLTGPKLFGGCPKVELRFEKEGYTTEFLTFPGNSVNLKYAIYLVPEK